MLLKVSEVYADTLKKYVLKDQLFYFNLVRINYFFPVQRGLFLGRVCIPQLQLLLPPACHWVIYRQVGHLVGPNVVCEN